MSRLERLYSPPEIGAPGRRQAQARQRDLLLAGLFVVAMAALFVGALALVSPGLFGGAYRLHAFFADADGLDRGIPVLQFGYRIGVVESVVPVFPGRDTDAERCPPRALAPIADAVPEATTDAPTNTPAAPAPRSDLPCFRVTLRIREPWPLASDSRAQLGAAGLLQGNAVRILPGGAPTSLAPGAQIAVQPREADLLAQLGRLTDTLQALVEETIAPALENIQQMVASIGVLIGTSDEDGGVLTGEGREHLSGVFESLRRLSADIEGVIDPEQLTGILAAVEQMAHNLAQVSGTFTERSTEVQGAVQDFGALAADLRLVIQSTRPGLEGSIEDTQFVLQELAAALVPILTNIEDASRNLSALARELRESPVSTLRGHERPDQAPWFDAR